MKEKDTPDRSRKVIHIDMDAFYATVEQRDNPFLRGKAMAVDAPKGWGIISAASYEARALGVKGGMRKAEALSIFPQLILVRARMDAYEEASAQVHKIFSDYTNLIEPVFLDEAYLDVTENKTLSATAIAKEIRYRIETELNLRASAGVSYNKFLAKLGSDYCKPNGLIVIKPNQGASFVENIAIELFHGVGKATAAKMAALGITTGKELREYPLEGLVKRFGKLGHYYHHIGNGDDSRPVITERERKSFGVERSFKGNLVTSEDIVGGLELIISEIWLKCIDYKSVGRNIALKIRYADFSFVNKTITLPTTIKTKEELRLCCLNLLETMAPFEQPVRLIGIYIATLQELSGSPNQNTSEQLKLF